MRTEKCDRCDSTILEETHTRSERMRVSRHVGDGQGWEQKEVLLCSMCYDDLWAWTAGDGARDRSGVADPLPLDRMADSVERHINDLESALEAIDEERDD